MSENENNNRKRVKQIRKRGIEDRSFEYVKADRLRREPIGLKMRAIPRAESRLDAILAAVAIALGFLCVGSLFLFFYPAEADVTVLLSFYYVGLECMMISPGLSPCKRNDSIFFIDLVGQPSSQSMVGTDECPDNVGLACRQRVFDVNTLFFH